LNIIAEKQEAGSDGDAAERMDDDDRYFERNDSDTTDDSKYGANYYGDESD